MEVAPKNDINGHISQGILSQLVQKGSLVLKSLNLENHLKKCQRCDEIVNIKNWFVEIWKNRFLIQRLIKNYKSLRSSLFPFNPPMSRLTIVSTLSAFILSSGI